MNSFSSNGLMRFHVKFIYTETTLYPKFTELMMCFKSCRIIAFITLTPMDTGRQLNVHKTLKRRSRRPLNILCTFNLRPVS